MLYVHTYYVCLNPRTTGLSLLTYYRYVSTCEIVTFIDLKYHLFYFSIFKKQAAAECRNLEMHPKKIFCYSGTIILKIHATFV